MSFRRLSSAVRLAVLTFILLAIGGCKNRDADRELRAAWLQQQTTEHGLFLRAFLNGTPDMVFYDGWYPIEHDPKSKSAWRWMDRRGIVRLRTMPEQRETTSDMELTVYGWAPKEHLGVRTAHLEFAVNGHVLGRLEAPDGPFEHKLFVPRHLLDGAEFVDFVITAANTARPNGDWRDLGFATTGFRWKPAGST